MENFWIKVQRTISADADGAQEFPLISDLVARIIVLPHSSATCERVFSQINLNKTKVRNKLSTQMITSLLYAKKLDVYGDYPEMFPHLTQNMYEGKETQDE